MCESQVLNPAFADQKPPALGPAPPASSDANRKSMQGNRSRDTEPELCVRRALVAKGLKGYRVDWKKAPGRPDIAYVSQRVAVFINGCFWHRCPHCNLPIPKTNSKYWTAKFLRNVERDARKVKELTDRGWRVVELWECKTKSDLNGCVETVRRELARI